MNRLRLNPISFIILWNTIYIVAFCSVSSRVGVRVDRVTPSTRVASKRCDVGDKNYLIIILYNELSESFIQVFTTANKHKQQNLSRLAYFGSHFRIFSLSFSFNFEQFKMLSFQLGKESVEIINNNFYYIFISIVSQFQFAFFCGQSLVQKTRLILLEMNSQTKQFYYKYYEWSADLIVAVDRCLDILDYQLVQRISELTVLFKQSSNLCLVILTSFRGREEMRRVF